MVDEKLRTGLTQSEKENIIKMMEDKARLEAEMYSVEGRIAHEKRKSLKQGREEGREEGKEQERMQMILTMSESLSALEIAKILKMNIEEVEKILNK